MTYPDPIFSRRWVSLSALVLLMAAGVVSRIFSFDMLILLSLIITIHNIYYMFIFSNKAYLADFGLWQSSILLTGFILIPRLFIFIEDFDRIIFDKQPSYFYDIEKYTGSISEFSIFVAAITLSAFFAIRVKPLDVSRSGWLENDIKIRLLALVATLFGAALYATLRSLVPADVSFPLMALGIAILVVTRSRLVILAVACCFASALVNHEIKLSLAVLALALVGWLRQPSGRWKLTWAIAVMGALVVAVPLLFASHYVTQTGKAFDNANFALRAKLFLRQADTGHCINVVFDRHWQVPSRLEGIAQMFEGLVPRLVWHDKPQLSDGRYYAEEYCNRRGGEGTPNSATLTVIGEPVLLAGKMGLIVAVLTLLGIAMVNDWAVRRWRWGLAVSLALWPLAIDVDQNFVMYIARLGKGALVVVGLTVLFQWFVRVNRPMPSRP